LRISANLRNFATETNDMNRQLPLFDDTELGTRMHPDWLRQANEVWHGCYDYTDSDYQGSKKPIYVFCPKHQQTVIEYNGIQHYEAVAHFKKDKPHWTLADQQERDRTLRDLCRERHLLLLEIPYTDFDRIGDILAENLLKKPLSEHETAFLSEK
jgi:hypothetical protein